jgi:protocatechuate 3,4-dioxygenase beta subunit
LKEFKMNRDRFIQNYNRREVLNALGLGAVTILFGHDAFRSILNGESESGAHAASLPGCVIRPEQTEGPYFVDEKLNRSDIRIDPADKTNQPGVPFRLAFQVSRIEEGVCAPLSAAIVDVWHCNALGVYSDVRDRRFDARGKKFLRGYQQTDANGHAEFLTIYPGWYEGRSVHIHFKIRTAGSGTRAHEFTSQLYFDEAVTDFVFRQAPYHSKQGHRTMNDADFLYRRGGKDLLLTPKKSAQGYVAKFAIGLRTS